MKIVIIGGGAAGLGIGWRLLQRGAEVTILERTQPGHGATWAAAGMIAPVGEGLHGFRNPFIREASALWPDFAEELKAQGGIDVDYRRNGALFVAINESDANTLGEHAVEDDDLELLNAPQALEREPRLAPLISGGGWAPGEAQVDNRVLGEALALVFRRAGGTLQRNESAVKFEIEGDRVVGLRSPFRLYHADAFVIAAGAWSSQFEGLPQDLLPPVTPIKGEMIALAKPQDARLPEHVIWGNEVYLVPRRRRLVVGATVEQAGFDTSVTDKAENWLRNRAIGLLPPLEQWEVEEHWAGLRPGSPDQLPILGPTAISNLFAATGQYRNGILFTPAIAEVMARTVLDGKLPPEYAAFDARRFK
jgi:glycine oxidase